MRHGWRARWTAALRVGASLTLLVLAACGAPATSRLAGPRASTALAPALAIPPAHRGELDVSTSLRGHTFLETPRAERSSEGSAYASVGSTYSLHDHRPCVTSGPRGAAFSSRWSSIGRAWYAERVPTTLTERGAAGP